MPKYIFTKMPDPDNQFDKATVTIGVDCVDAIALVEAFRDFMLGCGFHPETIKEYLNIEA